MNMFEQRRIAPMLIGSSSDAFDSPDFIYELKLDGIRCIAYLGKDTDLRNKRNMRLLPQFPELKNLHDAVNEECVLDGELIVTQGGVPVFSEIQRRSIMTDKFKIEISSRQFPASFVAFDILYTKSKAELTGLPVIERKEILDSVVHDTERLKVSRYVHEKGIQLYNAVEGKELEGIVAKRRDSLYYEGRRTRDWIKIKNLLDEDFVVLGYIPKENHMNSVILGQYRGEQLVYKGHVTLGVSGPEFAKIQNNRKLPVAPVSVPKGNESAVWVIPNLVCTVKFMEKSETGSMRQPVFKGLRDDKEPGDCVVV